ncbi:hypothetical protein BU24DRAFT_91591 [Aaosphaeria arxii CBS 175.79]|uniref:Uncharacterized protein n=1 Tax=Aaosphaeria arxii CBS 175.79 TaxID=1450172 RepID=A0A6A5X7I7_9PLEO|nr:uncharacterized protein BU24DRAFT_91591 [Aaosphaeria arxii CBS 175.79]KAF2008777.1 hypothetical protein BU24DRAFT_91591 [Aaosphaeria arxii CBS 175.79]
MLWHRQQEFRSGYICGFSQQTNKHTSPPAGRGCAVMFLLSLLTITVNFVLTAVDSSSYSYVHSITQLSSAAQSDHVDVSLCNNSHMRLDCLCSRVGSV